MKEQEEKQWEQWETDPELPAKIMVELTKQPDYNGYYRLVVDGKIVPHLTVSLPWVNDVENEDGRQETNEQGQELYFVLINGQMGMHFTMPELDKFGWFIANSMAVAAGFASHGSEQRLQEKPEWFEVYRKAEYFELPRNKFKRLKTEETQEPPDAEELRYNTQELFAIAKVSQKLDEYFAEQHKLTEWLVNYAKTPSEETLKSYTLQMTEDLAK
jgi:hypothetical protein